VQRKAIIALSVLSAVLAVLCASLLFLLYSKPRFIASKSKSPYIMFDTKTVQACWSGPANNTAAKNPSFNWDQYPVVTDSARSSDSSGTDPFAPYEGHATSPAPNIFDEALATNSAGLPFCKNLK
jgi:hypothetical protein